MNYVQVFFKTLDELGHLFFCLSRDNQMLWANARALDFFRTSKRDFQLRTLKQYFKKEDEWQVSKAFIDALEGRPTKRVFELRKSNLSQMEFHFFPFLFEEQESVLVVMSPLMDSSQEREVDRGGELIEQQRLISLGKAFERGRPKFSKVKRGDFQKVNLGKIIENVQAILAQALERSKVQFISCDTKTLPDLYCRPEEIEQVLLNLFHNSLDFFQSPAGEKIKDKWIRLEVNERLEKVELMVTDAGLGISSPIKEKMFKENYSSQGRPSGMGLVTTKKILARHQGKISYQDNFPHTRFKFFISKKPHKEAA